MRVTRLEANARRNWWRLEGRAHVDWQSEAIVYGEGDNRLLSARFGGSETLFATPEYVGPYEFWVFTPKSSVRWAVAMALSSISTGHLDLFDLEADQPFFRCYTGIFAERQYILDYEDHDGGLLVLLAMNKTIIAIGWWDGSVTVHDLLNGEYKGQIVRDDPQVEQSERGLISSCGPTAIYLHPVLAKGVLVYIDTYTVAMFDMELDPEDTGDA